MSTILPQEEIIIKIFFKMTKIVSVIFSGLRKHTLLGASIWNKGVNCEVREKTSENIKRLAKRQAEETKAQINSVCP